MPPEAEAFDVEVAAIQTIVAALTPLDAESRGRVIGYVFNRLGLRASITTGGSRESEVDLATSEPVATGIRDVRTLKEEKQPKSAIEMTALVAYYLAELAPTADRTDVIDADDVKRYFKQAQFPLPAKLHMTLIHAKNAGLLDSAGQGSYRLNPVGYNLVVHGLPGSRSGDPSVRRRTKSPGKKAKRPATRRA